MGCSCFGLGDREFLTLVERLRKVECPLQQDAIRATSRVEVSQVGDAGGNVVFDLGTRGAWFMMEIAITAVKSGVFIAEYDLLLPWTDPYFHWLECDESAPKYAAYSFPRKAMSFERRLVLNHKKGYLRRGECWDGLLLGMSATSIPVRYERGGIRASLRVFDNLGVIASTAIVFSLDRSARRRSMPARTGSGLFGKADLEFEPGRTKQPDEGQPEPARYSPADVKTYSRTKRNDIRADELPWKI